jgi:hypothetical protein
MMINKPWPLSVVANTGIPDLAADERKIAVEMLARSQ